MKNKTKKLYPTQLEINTIWRSFRKKCDGLIFQNMSDLICAKCAAFIDAIIILIDPPSLPKPQKYYLSRQSQWNCLCAGKQGRVVTGPAGQFRRHWQNLQKVRCGISLFFEFIKGMCCRAWRAASSRGDSGRHIGLEVTASALAMTCVHHNSMKNLLKPNNLWGSKGHGLWFQLTDVMYRVYRTRHRNSVLCSSGVRGTSSLLQTNCCKMEVAS